MAGCRIPGPLCATRSEPIDAGTLCLWATPAPGSFLGEPGPALQRHWHAQSISGGFVPALMMLGPEGLALLKSVEELHLAPYDDQSGDDTDHWLAGATIGYGHLIARSDWDRYKGGISERAAQALLAADLAPFERLVGACVNVGLQQYEFDALVLLAFNIGPTAFPGSSVVKLVNDPHATTAYADLEGAWKAWNKSQGKVMKGLDNRRRCEWRVYMIAIYERW